jgi:hypothetical protein
MVLHTLDKELRDLEEAAMLEISKVLHDTLSSVHAVADSVRALRFE